METCGRETTGARRQLKPGPMWDPRYIADRNELIKDAEADVIEQLRLLGVVEGVEPRFGYIFTRCFSALMDERAKPIHKAYAAGGGGK